MTLPFCSTAHKPSMLIFSRPNSSASVARLPLLCGTTMVKSYACMTGLLSRAPSVSAGPTSTVRVLSHETQPMRTAHCRRATHTGLNPWRHAAIQPFRRGRTYDYRSPTLPLSVTTLTETARLMLGAARFSRVANAGDASNLAMSAGRNPDLYRRNELAAGCGQVGVGGA